MFKNYKIISYIGNKTNLYNFIIPELKKALKNKDNFYEFFSGTNSISFEINKISKNKNIFANDISLYSKIIFSILEISYNNLNINKLKEFMNYIDKEDTNSIIKKYNINEFYITNELSMNGDVKTADKKIFKNQEYNSRMYFPYQVGLKIDIIKYLIKNNIFKLNKSEEIIMLNMLLNYADRHANTTGVYGAYLKTNKIKKIFPFYNDKLFSNIITYIKENNKNNKKEFLQDDLLNIINNKDIKDSVIYFDPPYNTRDYQTNYHILNYIVDLDFNPEYIKYGSKTAVPKMNKRYKNISSSKKTIYLNLKEILKLLSNKNNKIFISYSNEGLLKKDDYKNLAKELNFNIEIKETKYKKYKSSKKETKNNYVNEYLIKLY